MKLSGAKKQLKPVTKQTGFIVYEGLSRFDKKPIVAIATMETKNAKTGNMVQLWIMRSDIEPHQAIKTGDDISICGGCSHRHFSGGACYVTVHQAPLAVYRAYKRGNYKKLPIGELKPFLRNRGLRFGAYGDVAMIPIDIIKQLHSMAQYTTGYTHQWKNKRLQDTLDYCQGSVDNITEYYQLKSINNNAKSFRVANHQNELLPNEIECKADSHGLSCAECRLCDGAQQDIAIMVHGNKANKFNSDIEAVNV